MSKSTALPVLVLAAVLLSGCTAAPEAGGERTTGTPSASPSASASPSVSPSGESTPSEDPSPEATEAPGGTEESSPAPTAPAPTAGAPAGGPADQDQAPQHAEPGGEQPSTAHQGVAHPQPADAPQPEIAVSPGLLRIGGSGYAPGEMISILFSQPGSDYNLLIPDPDSRVAPGPGVPEAVVTYAGPDGSYTFDIDISPGFAPGEYGIMTWAPDRGRAVPGSGESSKRFLTVHVTG